MESQDILSNSLRQRRVVRDSATDKLTGGQTIEFSDEPGGIWRSQGGSLYVIDSAKFICIAVHNEAYSRWLNKVAVADIHRTENGWRARQAFRNPVSGRLINWEEIMLYLEKDRIIKQFPQHLPLSTLTYGYVEHYYRVCPH